MWDRTTSALLDPLQPKSLSAIFDQVKTMVLDLTAEHGTISMTGDRYMVPGGCDTGGWVHLSDIRRKRRFI